MDSVSALETLLRRARARIVWNVLLNESAVAVTAGLCAVAALLLLGTQILDWYWPVALTLVTLGLALFRLRKKIPSAYRVAQHIDRRLELSDTLSTAYHFSRNSSGRPEVVKCQREIAQQTASTVDVRAAAPIALPRSAWGTVAACVVACALFGVRYGTQDKLDLSKPMVSGFLDVFRAPVMQALNKQQPKRDRKIHEELDALGVSTEQGEAGRTPVDNPGAPDEAQGNADIPDVNDIPNDPNPQQGQRGTPSSQPQDDNGEGTEEGQSSQEGSDKGSQDQNGQQGQTGKQGPQQNAKQSPQAGENSSLMDKLRNAMADLMSKMKMQPKSGDGRQMASSQQGGQQFARPQQGKGERGEQAPGQQQSQNGSSSESQGEQQGEGGQNAQGAQGQASDQGSDRQAQQDAKSGIGKQDGAKDIRDAEQLAAMGKISEIFGKRAANITGEVMVEVPSGKQQLRTPYLQRRAAHSDSGAEIHRDEVPLIYQHYIQQYFEEVRKTPVKK